MKIGVAGYGYIGKVYVDVLAEIIGKDNVFIADSILPDESVKIPSKNQYSNYRDLPRFLDAIVISLPTDLHFESVKYYSSYNIPILIEKPLEINGKLANELMGFVALNDTKIMCGLTGLYHPEFRAMYDNLNKLGDIKSVKEHLHEANPELIRFINNGQGVLGTNGIHTLHRFYEISKIISPVEDLEVKDVCLSKNYFPNVSGTDSAKGTLLLSGCNTVFDFELSFRDGYTCDNGYPIDYLIEIVGSNGSMKIIGWEKCELWDNAGNHKIYYEHPDGILGNNTQYPRLKIGLKEEIEEFFNFIESDEKLHPTMISAANSQALVEKCFKTGMKL